MGKKYQVCLRMSTSMSLTRNSGRGEFPVSDMQTTSCFLRKASEHRRDSWKAVENILRRS